MICRYFSSLAFAPVPLSLSHARNRNHSLWLGDVVSAPPPPSPCPSISPGLWLMDSPPVSPGPAADTPPCSGLRRSLRRGCRSLHWAANFRRDERPVSLYVSVCARACACVCVRRAHPPTKPFYLPAALALQHYEPRCVRRRSLSRLPSFLLLPHLLFLLPPPPCPLLLLFLAGALDASRSHRAVGVTMCRFVLPRTVQQPLPLEGGPPRHTSPHARTRRRVRTRCTTPISCSC